MTVVGEKEANACDRSRRGDSILKSDYEMRKAGRRKQEREEDKKTNQEEKDNRMKRKKT